MNSSELKEYFNNLAGEYSINEIASLNMTNYMRRKLTGRIKSYKNKSDIDIMSGRGENLKFLSNDNNLTNITTLDFAVNMNISASCRYGNITQMECDFFDAPFINNSFDILICSYGLKTIPNLALKTFSKKIQDIIKPDGEILLLELVKPENKLVGKIIHFYLNSIVPRIFGKKFKILASYLKTHENMNDLKNHMLSENLQIIEHNRYFDLFEIIHAKKTTLG